MRTQGRPQNFCAPHLHQWVEIECILHTFASEAFEMKELVFRQFDCLTFAPLSTADTCYFACGQKTTQTTSIRFWKWKPLLFHRVTRAAYLYNGCLSWYNVVITSRVHSSVKWLEWDKWVLTKFDHDRQWFNTLIPPSHETATVTVDCVSRLSGPVRLILRYTTVDIHCKDRQ